MIKKVKDMILTNFMTIGELFRVQRMQDLIGSQAIEYFIVSENSKINGIVTYKDIIMAHPNRIAADVMNNAFGYVDENTTFWRAKDLFEEKNISILLVKCSSGTVKGILTRDILETEANKHIDPLTGLYRKEYIYYSIEKSLFLNNKNTILFIDVDNFGDIDKKCGHIVGDNILIELSKLLANNIENIGAMCRFGGDEFVISTSLDRGASVEVAKSLIETIARKNFYDKINISISIGLCHIEENINFANINIISKLINKASLASTQAKHREDKLHMVSADEVINCIA